jgi:hypothetical protein
MSNIVHGRTSTYNNHRCRCEDCTKAQRDYTRKYRATKAGRKKINLGNRKARIRNQLAAEWVKEEFPAKWEQICRAVNLTIK